MSPAITSLIHDCIPLFQSLLMSRDDGEALRTINAMLARITAALKAMEASA